jgi:hypothetical protein
MDDWRNRIAADLLGVAPTSTGNFAPDGAASLEIALGLARTEVAYFLAIGRTNQLPMNGNVQGDDVWLQLGATKLRFLYARKEHAIVATVAGHDEIKITWDAPSRRLVVPTGEAFDMKDFVRRAIEDTVATWKADPVPLRRPPWPDPPARAVIHGVPGYVPPGPAQLVPKAEGAREDDSMKTGDKPST